MSAQATKVRSVIALSADEFERESFKVGTALLPELEYRPSFGIDELLRDISTGSIAHDAIILVGRVEGPSALNVVGTLHRRLPGASIVIVLPSEAQRIVDNAMLAGACAALNSRWRPTDLALVLKRILSRKTALQTTEESALLAQTQADGLGTTSGQEKHVGQAGRVVAVMGAKGGCGKSTIALAVAWLLARSGIKTAILDYDFQYGDLAYLLNWDDAPTLEELSSALMHSPLPAKHCGHQVAPLLTAFSFRPSPREVRLFKEVHRACLDRLAHEYDVVVVNTGAFWDVFQRELAEQADLALVVTQQSLSATRATLHLKEHLETISGMSHAPLFIVNRVRGELLNPSDIETALDVDELVLIEEGTPEFQILFEGGNIEAALEEWERTDAGMGLLIEKISALLALPVHSVNALRNDMAKKRRWFRK